MQLFQWANRHGISPQALAELRTVLTYGDCAPPVTAPAGSEAAVQQLVRLEASMKGMRLYRNNVGACKDENGRMIRYGLCNESTRMNRAIKSSDLIGIKPVMITPQHTGCVIGQFVAREIKAPGWVYKGTDREQAQQKFINLIAGMGGDACFATGEGTL